jgi:hypothetical protein
MNLIFFLNEFIIFIDIRVMMFIVQYVLMICDLFLVYLMCRLGPPILINIKMTNSIKSEFSIISINKVHLFMF